MGDHIVKHGDGVKDVALLVDDCRAVFASAKENGAEIVSEPHEESDEHGSVVLATIKTVCFFISSFFFFILWNFNY